MGIIGAFYRPVATGQGLTTFRAKLTFDPYLINIIIIRAGFRGGVEGVFPENENAI